MARITMRALFDIFFTSYTFVVSCTTVCFAFHVGNGGQCFWHASGSRFGPALPLWLMILMRQFVMIKTTVQSYCGAQCVPITLSYL